MGFLDIFSSSKKKKDAEKGKEAKQSAEPGISDYNAMRFEVLNEGGEQVMTARMAVSGGGTAELQAAPNMPSLLDPEEENVHVFLRGYQQDQQKTIHMEGDVSPLLFRVWRLENVKISVKESDRAYFRQKSDISGNVASLDGVAVSDTGAEMDGGDFGCRVINISAGGCCIQTKLEFEVGDELILSAGLIPGKGELTLLCSVRRAVRRKGEINEYGCQFAELDDATRDEISRAIIQMQMKKIKR